MDRCDLGHHGGTSPRASAHSHSLSLATGGGDGTASPVSAMGTEPGGAGWEGAHPIPCHCCLLNWCGCGAGTAWRAGMVIVPLWLLPSCSPGLSQAPSSATSGYPSSSSPLPYLSLRTAQDPQQQLLFGRGAAQPTWGQGHPVWLAQFCLGSSWRGNPGRERWPCPLRGPWWDSDPGGLPWMQWDAPLPGAEVV